jgi:hypothetical protein
VFFTVLCVTLDWRASHPTRPDSGCPDPNGYGAPPSAYPHAGNDNQALPPPQAAFAQPYPTADGGANGYEGSQPQPYPPHGSQVLVQPPSAFWVPGQEPYQGAPQSHDLGGDRYTPSHEPPIGGPHAASGQQPPQQYGGYQSAGNYAAPQQPFAADNYGQPLAYGYGATTAGPPGYGASGPSTNYALQPHLAQQYAPGYGQPAPMPYFGQQHTQQSSYPAYPPSVQGSFAPPQLANPWTQTAPGVPGSDAWWTPDGFAPPGVAPVGAFHSAPAMAGQAFGLLASMTPTREAAPSVGPQGYYERPPSTPLGPPESAETASWSIPDDAPRYSPPGSDDEDGDPFGIREIPQAPQAYRGPQIVPTDAFAGVVFGVFALLLFPVALFGFSRSRRAGSLIASAPNRYKGRAVAVAGLTLNALSPVVSIGIAAATFGYI